MTHVGTLTTLKKLKLIAVVTGRTAPAQFGFVIYLFLLTPRVLGRAISLKLSGAGVHWRVIRCLS